MLRECRKPSVTRVLSGLPVHKHLLTPRLKGVLMSLTKLRSVADAVYDVTVGFASTRDVKTGRRLPAPGMLGTSVRQSVCPSVLRPSVLRPSIRLPARPSARPLVRPSARLSAPQPVRLPACLSVRPSVCPPDRLPVRPYVRLLACRLDSPSVYPPVRPSVADKRCLIHFVDRNAES